MKCTQWAAPFPHFLRERIGILDPILNEKKYVTLSFILAAHHRRPNKFCLSTLIPGTSQRLNSISSLIISNLCIKRFLSREGGEALLFNPQVYRYQESQQCIRGRTVSDSGVEHGWKVHPALSTLRVWLIPTVSQTVTAVKRNQARLSLVLKTAAFQTQGCVWFANNRVQSRA